MWRIQIPCHTHNLKPVLADYIYHKNEKGKLCEMDLPLLKNDIITILVSVSETILGKTYRLFPYILNIQEMCHTIFLPLFEP